MERYKAKQGKGVFYVFPAGTPEEEAIKMANRKFKCREYLLIVDTGYVWKDELFWDRPHKKATPVVVVFRKG